MPPGRGEVFAEVIMAARLGDVFYWAGCAIAIVVTLTAAWTYVENSNKTGSALFALSISILYGGSAYGGGWALRYVLSGKK